MSGVMSIYDIIFGDHVRTAPRSIGEQTRRDIKMISADNESANGAVYGLKTDVYLASILLASQVS